MREPPSEALSDWLRRETSRLQRERWNAVRRARVRPTLALKSVFFVATLLILLYRLDLLVRLDRLEAKGGVRFSVGRAGHAWLQEIAPPSGSNDLLPSREVKLGRDIDCFPDGNSAFPAQIGTDACLAEYLGSLRPPRLDLDLPAPAAAQHLGDAIPNVVHFVYGMERRLPIPLHAFLAVRSALLHVKPRAVYFWYTHEPHGLYWDLIKPMVIPIRVDPVTEVFGNEVKHYAHKADVVRLRALLENGGVYMDLDVIALKSFDSLLRSGADMVMGQEGDDGRVGLCNAVILAKRDSEFLKRWYEAYRTFDESQWNYHSVILPKKMAEESPHLIKVVSHRAFFWPLWDDPGITELYERNSYDFRDNLAVHLWSSKPKAKPLLSGMDLGSILREDAAYHTALRPLLPHPWISVVVACYNQKQFVEDAILSVVGQTFHLWEIIVVDDASPDGCGDFVLNKLVPRHERLQVEGAVRVLRNKANLGLAGSRNAGIAAAAGFWVCALDADDAIGREYFAAAQRAMTSDLNLEILYADQDFYQEDLNSKKIWSWIVPEVRRIDERRRERMGFLEWTQGLPASRHPLSLEGQC